MIIAIQRKNDIYMKKNSRERYYCMIEQIRNFSQRVPQYMIASYLGVTKEFLSRMRKRLAQDVKS